MKLVVLAILVTCCIIQVTSANEKPNKAPESGKFSLNVPFLESECYLGLFLADRNIAVDEVIVDSVLNIRPNKQQQQVRRVRQIPRRQ